MVGATRRLVTDMDCNPASMHDRTAEACSIRRLAFWADIPVETQLASVRTSPKVVVSGFAISRYASDNCDVVVRRTMVYSHMEERFENGSFRWPWRHSSC